MSLRPICWRGIRTHLDALARGIEEAERLHLASLSLQSGNEGTSGSGAACAVVGGLSVGNPVGKVGAGAVSVPALSTGVVHAVPQAQPTDPTGDASPGAGCADCGHSFADMVAGDPCPSCWAPMVSAEVAFAAWERAQ